MAAPMQGIFVPTTNIWDIQQLKDVNVNSPEFKELLIRLYQNVNNIALAVNNKDTSIYDVLEIQNGQTFFPNPNAQPGLQTKQRTVLRKVFNFGALPNAATKTMAHGITCTVGGTTFTRIYGCSSDTTNRVYIPIPYADTAAVATNVELFVDATNINVITGTNRTSFDTTYIILEYMQY